eukprot:c24720_g1_i2 orf=139-1680(+)
MAHTPDSVHSHVPLCKRNSVSSTACKFMEFLLSDASQEFFDIVRLFVTYYAPYVIGPFILLVTALGLNWVGLEWFWMVWSDPKLRIAFVVAATSMLAVVAGSLYKLRPLPCYLVDFCSFKSLDNHKLNTEICVYATRTSQQFTERNLSFQLKVLLKSGLGEETYGPSFFFKENGKPCLKEARDEMEHMMFGALDKLFYATGVQPTEVDFLIANISMFYPAPSLSAHVVNHYKMRADVKSYNISGMGCAAGMVAVDLARDLLRVHKNRYVVIVGTENITLNWYFGNDRSMLVPNCLFRCGSYALLLSNKKSDRSRAKFQLLHSIRTTIAADDKAYCSIITREDDDGIVGTSLSVKLLDVASKALRINITKLVPLTMPASELLKVVWNVVLRTTFGSREKPYMPDFKKAITHFCIHPGGRAVIDGIGKNLRLSDYDLEPARMTLHRFGNTSSSGLWYALAYCEAKHRLKKGDTVWQVALGSGFKCNSVVWKVLADVCPTFDCNPWLDCIHRYPVE